MSTSKNILKTYFETGDFPSESQFGELIDSFRHIDDGKVIKNFTINANGDLLINLSSNEVIQINQFVLPSSMPVNFITGLQNIIDNSVTVGQLNEAIATSAYGIKYSWSNANERNSQTGMKEYEQGVQQDTREVYRYNGSSWVLFYALDATHNHDGRYYSKTQSDAKFITEQRDVSNLLTSTSSVIAASSKALKMVNDKVNNKLDKDDKAADSDKLDGLDSTQFLRSDAFKLRIKDTRNEGDRKPNSYENSNLELQFTDDIVKSPNTWDSVLTLKGWSDNYAVWQLFSNSSADDKDGLYFRRGRGNTWGGIQKLATEAWSNNKFLTKGTDILLTNKELKWAENTDGAAIGFKNTRDRDTDSYLYFKTLDNRNEYFKWIHQVSGREETEWMQLKEQGLKVLGDVYSGNNFRVQADHGKGLRFWDSDAYKIFMAGRDSTGGKEVKEWDTSSIDYNMYFKMTSYKRGWVFYNLSNKQAKAVRPACQITGAGDLHIGGNLYGKAINGAYSHLYRFGGVHFTWDSDTYGTEAQHSIKSTYGTAFGDSLTMNSYNNIRLNIDSNNNNSNSKFEIGHNTSGVSNVLFSVDESGTVKSKGDIIAYSTSDMNLKNNIKPISSPLTKINQLSGNEYEWNKKQDTYDEGSKDYGVIAQEVAKVLPKAVRKNKDTGYLSVCYEKLMPLLIEGIKEQQQQIEELKTKLNGITN